MNINSALISALNPTGLPVEQDEYEGEEDKYIVFSYANESPALSGDDMTLVEQGDIHIQLVAPKKFNYFPMKKKIVELLEGAGFYVTDIQTILGDGNGIEKVRQIVFECVCIRDKDKEEL